MRRQKLDFLNWKIFVYRRAAKPDHRRRRCQQQIDKISTRGGTDEVLIAALPARRQRERANSSSVNRSIFKWAAIRLISCDLKQRLEVHSTG